MLKILAIFSLALLVICVEASQPHKTQETSQSDKPTLPTVSPVVPKQNNSPNLQPKADNRINADVRVISVPAKDNYDRAAFWISVALAAVGILGIVIGACTLLFIKAQVVEMRRQAHLMKTQADHMEMQTRELRRQNRNMLTAERAWVVETIHFLDDIPRRFTSGGGLLVAGLTLKNIGKQPAFLKILQTRLHAPERLADSPEFRTTEPFPDGYMLAPDQEMRVRVMLEEGSFDDEQVDRIQGRIGTQDLFLRFYGCVIYESVGVRGVNRFCYTWRNLMGFSLEGDRARFEKGGPEGYNSHT